MVWLASGNRPGIDPGGSFGEGAGGGLIAGVGEGFGEGVFFSTGESDGDVDGDADGDPDGSTRSLPAKSELTRGPYTTAANTMPHTTTPAPKIKTRANGPIPF